ncbi:unnamed protein product [Cyprideis torosa]|uniref:Uncharacterized protein n=1 Tax=Cyprideis torosa TaxID=163714 RepID=A0A7R8WDK2_9CRUS|nr:unnamed protein product [Cyprideis torosa]CAG0888426.1 unnamed protein product [Cyprideis torosa]
MSYTCGISPMESMEDPIFTDEKCFIPLSHRQQKHSTWTIDLAYLLKRFQISCTYYTITPGVDMSYKSDSFYGKVLEKDSERVTRKFAEAPSVGVEVNLREVDLEEILRHLSTNHQPVIALVNSSLLFCVFCNWNRLGAEARMCCPLALGYQGHYIVVCGYNRPRGLIYYRNPSLRDRVCCLPFDSFELSRTCRGTDQDLLFINPSAPPRPDTGEEVGSGGDETVQAEDEVVVDVPGSPK